MFRECAIALLSLSPLGVSHCPKGSDIAQFEKHRFRLELFASSKPGVGIGQLCSHEGPNLKKF